MGVNEFTNAEKYKGNDIDTDGDGSVNDAQTVQGNAPQDLATDLDPLRETILDLNVDISELDYAQGLNADSSDQIWVDPVVDSSKIASSSNVEITTGQNGNIVLAPATGSTASRDPDSNSYTDYERPYGVTINPNKDLTGLKVTISSQSSNISRVAIADGPNSFLVEKTTSNSYDSGEQIDFNVTLSQGKDYFVVADNQGSPYSPGYNDSANYPVSSNDIDIVNGATSLTGWGDFETGTTGNIFEVTAKSGYISSGTLTSVTIDKGTVPSVIQPDADLETDSETTVDVRAFDGNGNQQTWTESELGQSKSVNFSSSSFQLELQPQTSNTTKTPEVFDYGTAVIE